MYEYYVKIVDYYKNTNGDMQNEKDFFYHCKKFVYNHDYVYLYEEDYYKCSNQNLNEFYTIPIIQKTPSNLNLELIFHPM